MPEIPDINGFCFDELEVGETPETRLAIWLTTYISKDQLAEIRRMFKEMQEEDGLKTLTVEEMIDTISLAVALTTPGFTLPEENK